MFRLGGGELSSKSSWLECFSSLCSWGPLPAMIQNPQEGRDFKRYASTYIQNRSEFNSDCQDPGTADGADAASVVTAPLAPVVTTVLEALDRRLPAIARKHYKRIAYSHSY